MFYYKEESYQIIQAAMAVYNKLGPGFLESVYQEALGIEFARVNIPFSREQEISIFYDGIELQQRFRADFICYNKIIIELKSVTELNDAHNAQLLNYLRATGIKVGYLINFGHAKSLEYSRRVL